MADLQLPPELLSRNNKRLLAAVAVTEKRVSQAVQKRTREEYQLSAAQDGLKECRAKVEAVAALKKAQDISCEAEQRGLAIASREVSNLLQEERRAKIAETDLFTEISAIQSRIAEANVKVSDFTTATKVTSEHLARLTNKEKRLRDEAQYLSTATAGEVSRYNYLLKAAEAKHTEVQAARQELESTSLETRRVFAETQQTLTLIGQQRTDLNSVVANLSRVHNAMRSAERTAELNKKALHQGEEQRQTETVQRSEFAQRLQILKKENSETDTNVTAFTKLLNSKKAYLVERDAEQESLEAHLRSLSTELARAGEMLLCVQNEVSLEQQRLKALAEKALREERHSQQLHRHLQEAQTAAATKEEIANELEKMLQDFLEHEARLVETMKEQRRAKGLLANSLQELTETGSSLEKRIVQLHRNAVKKVDSLRDVTIRARRQGAALAAMQAVLAKRMSNKKETEEYLAAYQKNLMAKAARLQATLQSRALAVGSLVSANATAQAELHAALRTVEEAKQTKQAIEENFTLSKRVVDKLSKDLADDSASINEKALHLDSAQAVEQRTRGQVFRLLDELESEGDYKLGLEYEQRKRADEIEKHQGSLKVALRNATESRSSLVSELQEKQKQVRLLESRHDEIMNAVYTLATMDENVDADSLDGAVAEGEATKMRQEQLKQLEPEQLHARCIANATRIRMSLQQRGDALDRKLSKAATDSEKLSKALSRFSDSASNQKHHLATVAWQEPTACEVLALATFGKEDTGIVKLRDECRLSSERVSTLKQAIRDKEMQHRQLSDQRVDLERHLQQLKKSQRATRALASVLKSFEDQRAVSAAVTVLERHSLYSPVSQFLHRQQYTKRQLVKRHRTSTAVSVPVLHKTQPLGSTHRSKTPGRLFVAGRAM